MKWLSLVAALCFSSLTLATTATLSCDPPTTREDGTPLAISEIDKYEFTYTEDQELIEYAQYDQTPEDCGTIIDVPFTGNWHFIVYTHAVDGSVSQPSETFTAYIDVVLVEPSFSIIPSKPTLYAERIVSETVKMTDNYVNHDTQAINAGAGATSHTTSHTLVGTGTNRAVVAIVSTSSNLSNRHLNSLTLNGVAADIIGTAVGVDGGLAISVNYGVWLDANDPGAGTFDVISGYQNSMNVALVSLIELKNIDQTTPVAAALSILDTDQNPVSPLTVTATGYTDKFILSAIGEADASLPTTQAHAAVVSENSTKLFGWAEDATINAHGVSLSVAYDDVIATASEDYVWTGAGTGNIDALAVVGIVFNVISGGNTSISSSLESISFSTMQSSVSAGVDSDINSTLEAINLVPGSSVVQSDVDVSVVSSQSSILLAAQSSVIQSDVDSGINSVLETINLVPAQSVIQVGANTDINSALESIGLSPKQSIIQTGFDTAINSTVEPISLSGFISAVRADSSLTGSVESISVVANPGAITLGSGIGSSTESISLSSNSASIMLDSVISSQLQSIVLSELSSQVGISANIDAALESLTITPLGSVVTLDSGVMATLESLTLAAFSSTIISPVSAITVPGLEYTISGGLMHYTMPINKLHFTFRS